ncbi:MAG: hypothetical protein AMXMBFR12_01420 [Candidatus Babeliales bacterium]
MHYYIKYMAFLLLFKGFIVDARSIASLQPKIDAQVVDDITFWAGQMVEHAEFAADFTNDPEFKKEGLALAAKFKKMTKIKNPDVNSVSAFLLLAKQIKEYQAKVRSYLKKQTNEYPNKTINLDLLDHMDLETDYAIKKAEGKKLSKNEEIAFWSKEHEGEAKVIAVLSVPGSSEAHEVKKEAEEVKTSLGSNHRFWNNSLEKVEQGNAELNALAKKIEANPSINKIDPKLAKHEERERKRAQETFRKLELQK